MKTSQKIVLSCKDYTVSQKTFDLVINEKYDMLETFPKPNLEELPLYYESSDYISHTDSKESLVDKVYQFVKKYALNQKLKLINSFQTESKNLLDVGCGTGDFLKTCENAGWNVVGVEPSLNAQNIAKSKLKNANVIYGDLFELQNVQFDVITLWHVLEHVPDLEVYIAQLKKLLKPEGVLIIAVPNYKSFDALYYKQYWAAFDVPRHLWHFSKKSISLLFSNHQLKLETILPMKFDSFYVSILSEKYKKGHNSLLCAFWIGLRSNLKAMRTKEYSSLIYVLKND